MENYHGELESSSVNPQQNQQQPPLSTANSTAPVELTTAADFDAAKARFPYVVILVYATWCGPCNAFKPQYAKYAVDNTSKAKFFQTNNDLRLVNGISAIPTLVVFKNGRLIETIVGADLKRLAEVLPPL
jgi:thioredoxin 1